MKYRLKLTKLLLNDRNPEEALVLITKAREDLENMKGEKDPVTLEARLLEAETQRALD